MEIPVEKFEYDCPFKVLLSTRCRFDCRYCPNAWRKGEDIPPDKLASFIKTAGITKVFISSAISVSPDDVMEKICETGEAIRDSVDYLHLKIMPYCSKEYIKRAAEIADRISLNFESPRNDLLSEVSSFKDLKNFWKQFRLISKISRRLRKSFTTQIIVGLGESDYDVLKFAEKVYEIGAARVYYSPFVPIKNTPMEKYPAERKGRISLLYKADALLRLYGVSFKKLKNVLIDGYLPKRDPKVLLAERFGVEKPEDMPGIGPKKAKLIKMGVKVRSKSAAAFILGQKRLFD